MTTDIARMDSNAIAVLGGANEALARLGEWVQAAGSAQELVAQLVDTPFVPDAYRPKIDPRATPQQQAAARQVAIATGTAAVLQGITLGLDPLTALQQIYIVHGRPGMYTEIKVALVKAHGHEVWTEDMSDTRAVVCGRRRGTEYLERVTVTMDMARKAGWTSNQAYTKTPQDMLYARAAGRVCDRIAPDVLMGIASVEEIQDTIQTSAEVGNGVRTVTPRRRTPAPAPALEAAAVEDPPLDDEPATDADPTAPPVDHQDDIEWAKTKAAQAAAEQAAEQPDTITTAQSRKLYGLLRDKGKGDKEVALVYIAGVIDREVQSTKELSKAEASRVIDALDKLPTADADPTLDVEP